MDGLVLALGNQAVHADAWNAFDDFTPLAWKMWNRQKHEKKKLK